MDTFDVISLFGGLAFFLYGMHLLSTSLEKMVGGKLERVLRTMTSNRLRPCYSAWASPSLFSPLLL